MSDVRWVLWRPTEAGAGHEEILAEFTAPDRAAAENECLGPTLHQVPGFLDARVQFDEMTGVAKRARERRERSKPWLARAR